LWHCKIFCNDFYFISPLPYLSVKHCCGNGSFFSSPDPDNTCQIVQSIYLPNATIFWQIWPQKQYFLLYIIVVVKYIKWLNVFDWLSFFSHILYSELLVIHIIVSKKNNFYNIIKLFWLWCYCHTVLLQCVKFSGKKIW
jgi:hypothetical protein